MPLHRHSAVTRALDAVDTANGRGMGFLPALLPLVTAGASIYQASQQQEDASGFDPAMLALERKRMADEQASSRMASASEERGKVLRYALIGIGGLALLGGIGIFAWSRRAKNPRRRRGGRR